MDLFPDQTVQVLLRIFQPGREQLCRQQLEGFDLVRHQTGVGDHHLVGLFLPQILKFLQHFLSGLEVDRQGLVGIRELLGRQQDMPVHLVLRLPEMDVTGGADGFPQLLAEADDDTVEFPQVLLASCLAVAEHEGVVAQGLNFQIVVKGCNALQFVPILVIHHSLEQLAGFAGGADDQALPMGHQLAFWDGGHPLEIFQVGCRNQLVEVFQAHLVPGQNNDVFGKTVGLAAQRPQLFHLLIDGLEGVDPPLMEHFPERDQHVAHCGGIVAGPVVVEGGQVQMLRHNVQLVLAETWQQVLG